MEILYETHSYIQSSRDFNQFSQGNEAIHF